MSRDHRWYFLTNHALVLIEAAQNPDSTVKAISEGVGITERAVHRILAELIQEGYVIRRRLGRRNCYAVRGDSRFRHPKMTHLEVGRLFAALGLDGS